MRIIAFPKTGISYNDCFSAALQDEGVEVIEGVFSGGWLYQNLRRGDWLHMHWPSFAYNKPGSKVRQCLWFARFVTLLLMARAKGAQLAWTAHNLLPHDRCQIPAFDILGRHLVILLSRLILVHGPGPAEALQARFPGVRNKLVLIPHGHWIGYYKSDLSKDEARRFLAVPQDKPLFLFIGLCKPYKNLHELVATFLRSDLDATLVVAGKFSDVGYRNQIVELAGGDPRIHIREGFIPDDQMQHHLKACDYVVVPYREILTSGTAMLALSFGRPLISVDFGFLRDVISAESGILFPHDDPDGLARALAEAVSRSFDEEQIIRHARQFSFAQAASSFVRSLQAGKPVVV
ncbi:MAG: glycosyltransferase [Dechloromonas sp.]|nr:MAG: glycosyltransferase [Dechloromonas sp.]